jgi:energy-coupling factor transport system ATP-binding protein
VLIEHRLELVLPLVDRVVALNRQGRLLGEGAPQSFFHMHAAQLVAEGIWLPATVRLQLALGQAGVALPPLPLTPDAAAAVLRAHIQQAPPLRHAPSGVDEMTPASQPPAIQAEDLAFHYATGPAVLRGITLQAAQGDFLALVGSNGAGKSTLARLLIGLLTLQAGRLHILGRRVTARNARRLPQQVGYVFQNPEHQFVSETVADEIAFSLRGHLPNERIQRCLDRLLTQFQLVEHAQANPFTLSWGQKRRLSVATMLAVEPPILILDEPTLGQDQQNVAMLASLLREINAQGTTVVLITHDMELVADVARSVTVLHEGNLLYHGSVRRLFAHPDLLEKAQLDLPPPARLGHALDRPDLLTLADWVAAIGQADGISGLVRPKGWCISH